MYGCLPIFRVQRIVAIGRQAHFAHCRSRRSDPPQHTLLRILRRSWLFLRMCDLDSV